MNPKINTLISQFPILIFLSLHVLGNQIKSSINEKIEYESRNNRTNQRHWIQQGGNNHQSEERKKYSIKGVDNSGGWPINNQTHTSIYHSIHAPNQKPTLRPTTPSIHTDPQRENKEQRIEGDHHTTSDPWLSNHHCRTRTIVGPEPSSDHIHHERQERRERGKRRENRKWRESCENKKLFFFNNSGYSELVLTQAHCSSMPKILPFKSFDGVVFLVFWC